MIDAFRARYLSAVFTCCALTVAAEEPASTPSFTAGPRIPANVGFASNLSPEKRALTVLFDNMFVVLNPASKGLAAGTVSGQTATVTKVATIEVPYSGDQKRTRMTLDVRGYVSADGARVRLVAFAGDTATVLSLPVGTQDEGKTEKKVKQEGKSKKVKLKGKSKKAALEAAKVEGEADDGNFQERIVFNLVPDATRPVCQVSLFLYAEHDTDKDGSGGVLLAVDSLDFAFADTSKGKYRAK